MARDVLRDRHDGAGGRAEDPASRGARRAGSPRPPAIAAVVATMVALGGSLLACGSEPGVPVRPPAVDRTTIDFGTVAVGGTATGRVTLTSPAGRELLVLAVAVAGPAAADFRATGAGSCVAGRRLAPGAACTVTVAFSPGALGARRATLAIRHDGAGSPATVALRGEGGGRAALRATPAAVRFPETLVGVRAAPRIVTVANAGTADAVVAAPRVGGANAGDFPLAEDASCTAGVRLAPGASCRVAVAFAPRAAGARSAVLTVGPVSVRLQGAGRTPAPAPSLPASLVGAEWTRLPTDRHVVALTFDGGASADGVSAILSELRAEGVRATFFLSGAFVKRFPAEARAIAAGHPVGNHTATHAHMTRLSDAAARREVIDGAEAIRSVTGRDPRPLFRFPYGESDARTIRLVNGLGYGGIRWTVDTLGWKGRAGGQSTATVTRRVLDALAPGAIVLMHVGAAPDGTTLDAQALPELIARIRARGYAFATVRDALGG